MSLRSLGIFATLTLAGATSLAQAPDQDWAACRAALTRTCVIAEARRTLEALNQPASRAEAVDMLVGDLIDGKRVLDAYALLPALRQDGDSLPVRTRLAAALAAAAQFTEADRVAQSIQAAGWRAVAEVTVAEALAGRGDAAAARAKIALALQLAQGAGRPAGFAIRRIAVAMIRSGAVDEAIAIVRAVPSLHWRLRGLIDAADALTTTQPTSARELLREASTVAAAQGDPVWSIYDLRDIAVAQAAAGGTSEAVATLQAAADTARRFGDHGTRDTFLEVVGTGFAQAGLPAAALALVDTMNGDWPRVKVATAAAAVEAKAGRRAEAAAAYDIAIRAAEAGRTAARPFLHKHIAASEAAAGLTDRANASLARMSSSAALVDGPHGGAARAAAALARVLLDGGDPAATAATITEVSVRDRALTSLVEELLKAGRLDTATAAARAITTPAEAGYPMSLVAAAHAKAGKMGEALALLDAMPRSHHRRVNALAAIAAALDP